MANNMNFQIRGTKYDLDDKLLELGYKGTELPTLERKYFTKKINGKFSIKIDRPYSVASENQLIDQSPYRISCRVDKVRTLTWDCFNCNDLFRMIEDAESEANSFHIIFRDRIYD